MNETFTYKEVPAQVLEVWSYGISKQPVGFDTYTRLKDIIKRHPKFLPWEHKYDSIPQFVHDAYKREAYSYEMPKPKDNGEFIGLIPTILAETEIVDRTTEKPTSFAEMFANMFKAEREERERKEREKLARKKLWDKHYAKYGLEYRE